MAGGGSTVEPCVAAALDRPIASVVFSPRDGSDRSGYRASEDKSQRGLTVNA